MSSHNRGYFGAALGVVLLSGRRKPQRLPSHEVSPEGFRNQLNGCT